MQLEIKGLVTRKGVSKKGNPYTLVLVERPDKTAFDMVTIISKKDYAVGSTVSIKCETVVQFAREI